MQRLSFLRCLAAVCAVAVLPAAAADDAVVDLPTRSGVVLRALYSAPDTPPRAAAVLLPGGHGALRIYPNGSMGWGDAGFLVRNRKRFAQAGIAVLVVDAPSDRRSGLSGWRDSEASAADTGAAISWLRAKAGGVPVWLVGHSRGTESAAWAALALGPAPAGPDGLVLASPISSDSAFAAGKALTHFPLERLRLPVMVLSHDADACSVTVPGDLPMVTDRLSGAAPLSVVHLSGGTPQGDLCAHQGTHGFGGLDVPAVQAIVDVVLR